MVAALAIARPLHAGVKHNNDLFGALEEASLIHQNTDFGFFSTLSRDHNGSMRQNSFRLTQMDEVLPLLPIDIDTWMSQCEFIKPNRRVVNLARIPLLFVDLDCYTMTPQQALSSLLWHCDDIGLPHPSIVIFSGRGLQAKWLLDKPLPRWALPRWNHVQSRLVTAFAFLGADQNAKDASRVLRLVNTTNTKSNLKVQVIHTTRDSLGQPTRYSFEYAAEILLPNSRAIYDKKSNNHPFTEEEKQAIVEARLKREKKATLKLIHNSETLPHTALHRLSGNQLAWDRVEDIRTLVKIRGGVYPKQSMQTLFITLNFLLLSGATNSSKMYFEAIALAREFGFGEFHRSDELSTLYSKAKEYEAGKTVTFNGKEYPPLYTPKNTTLIDMFGITDDEQRQLRTIVSTDIAKERHAARSMKARRKAGAIPRELYLAANQEKKALALTMHSEGHTVRFIAQQIAVPKSTVSRWIS